MDTIELGKVVPQETTIVRIKDRGQIQEIDYSAAISKHVGSLWWGTAVGYRAMQAAAEALSAGGLWSRDDLYVVAAHPGPGVRDAIDYVTHVVGRDRYKLITAGECGAKCNSTMKFEWWVSDKERTAFIQLREDFVPLDFYHLSDRLGTPQESDDDRRMFEVFKVTLSTRIWAAPLSRNFHVRVEEKPLAVGELPQEAASLDYWNDLKTRRNDAGQSLGSN